MASIPCTDSRFISISNGVLNQLQNANSDYSVEINCVDAFDWWNDNIYSGRGGVSPPYSDQVGEINFKGLDLGSRNTTGQCNEVWIHNSLRQISYSIVWLNNISVPRQISASSGLPAIISGVCYNMAQNVNSLLRVVDAPNAGNRILSAGSRLCVMNRETNSVVRIIDVSNLVADPLNNQTFFYFRYESRTFIRNAYRVTNGNVVLNPAQYWTTNNPFRLSVNEDLLVYQPGAVAINNAFQNVGGNFNNVSIGRNAYLFQGAGNRALNFYLVG